MNLPLLQRKADVTGSASLPGYSPQNHGVGIVHLGVGAFHRAHQAVMTDDALAEHGGNWRIVGVSLRSKEIAYDLNRQNGLYTVLEKDAQATTARVVASIDRVIAADSKATLDALSDSDIRIVSITVSETGYGIERMSRMPDPSNPIVAADLASPDKPSGVLGLLVAAIARRRKFECAPFTVLSCDNLPENGSLLRDGVIGFARHTHGNELAHWIENNIAFPCCMVDRITPAATNDTRAEAAEMIGCEDNACIETERFSQWIIEDSFPSGRPHWEAGGVLFVSDVSPYERMKLTMLNGTHSMLAYAGYLAGCEYVRDAMNDSDLTALVQRHLSTTANLLKPLPGIDFNHYAAELAMRFSNPSIAHATYQIATDGTEKLPQRIFQPAIESLKLQQSVRPFAFTTAMWIRFCLQRLDDGTAYELRDPRSKEITRIITKHPNNLNALLDGFHALPQFIPQRLASEPLWRQNLLEVLATIFDNGCRWAIRSEAASM